MKLLFLAMLGAWLVASTLVQAETITLIDGTRLTGKVLSMQNGVYTVTTSSLGQIRINSSQVKSIASGNGQNFASGGNEFSALQDETFHSLQSAIANDKDAVAQIMELQNDPLMQAILADEEIMSAVSRGDYGALAENPKIQRLMKHRSVKSISRKYSQ